MKFIDAISLPAKLIRLFAVFIAALTLAACGGGGDGFPGFRDTSTTAAVTTALNVAAPNAVTVTVGAAQSYSISGGTAPYTVVSSNTGVSPATLVGANTLNVPGTTAGSAQIVVYDSTNKSVTISVTVVSASTSTSLFVIVPDGGVTIGAPGTGVYMIGGGTPGYKAIAGNLAVATANVVGTTLTITGASTGTTTVTVFDATLAKVSINVTVIGVGANPLATNAGSFITMHLPDSGGPAFAGPYDVTGGKPPYAISSSAGSVVDVTSASNSSTSTRFSLLGYAVGTAQIKILDSSNNQLDLSVTVAGPTIALFTSAPSSITIASGATPIYAIGGGTAPYSVVSNNVSVATASVMGGTTLNITGVAAGAANVVLTDAAGATLTIAVTVSSTTTTATPLVTTPSDASANVGNVLHFTVGGGSPAYHFVVNNTAIASVNPASVTSSGGTFTVTLLSAGSTTIAVVDVSGQSTTLTVTANFPTLPKGLLLSPSALTIGEDYADPLDLNILNGTAPYRAYTSDLVLSSVSITGTTLTVSTGTQGSRCINPGTHGTYPITVTVLDALGASATSVVTIQDNGKLSTGC